MPNFNDVLYCTLGILAQETDSSLASYEDATVGHPSYGDTYIPADYFQYIEMGGARGVPILYVLVHELVI